MVKKVLASSVIIVLFVIGFYFGFHNHNDSQTVKRAIVVMGTTVEVIIRGIDESESDKYFRSAFLEFERIDSLFSAYIPNNPVSLFNESAKDTVLLPIEIVKLLKQSSDFNRITDGAFDVAIGKLSEIWGFYQHTPQIPDSNKLQVAFAESGWKFIEIMDDSTVIKKNNVHLNFGAVSKGYAVDKASLKLKEMGLKEFLINAGGEIKAIGDEWVVGIQNPREQSSILFNLKTVNNEIAVATSGDYENFFLKDGIRYHHLIDPLTGYPASGCQSVTVLANDVATADALATGVFVLGPDKGLELIESLSDIECLIIDNKGKFITSSGFNKFIRR